MIEAVNSVLANSTAVRGVAEQVSTARSFAANPERVQEVAKAPYVSPYIRVDVNFDKAVLQVRDSDTGDVLRQYPSESQLQAYRRAQAAQSRAQALVEKENLQPQVQSSPAPDVPDVEVSAPQVYDVTVSAPQVQAQPAQPKATPSAPAAPAISVDTQA
jgi:uncharacterized FlaG/YvyC family protein